MSLTMIRMSFRDERTTTNTCATERIYSKLIGRQLKLIISRVGYPWRECDFSPEAISFFYLWLRHHETSLLAPCQRTIEISTKRVSCFLCLDLKFQDLTSSDPQYKREGIGFDRAESEPRRMNRIVQFERDTSGYNKFWCQLHFRSTTLSHKLDRSC